jgi:hypothetical protein
MQFIKINKLEIKAKDVTSLGYSPWNQQYSAWWAEKRKGKNKERKKVKEFWEWVLNSDLFTSFLRLLESAHFLALPTKARILLCLDSL